MTPDVLFHGGNIIPMTGPQDRAQSVAIAGGRVAAIGSDAELQGLRATAARAVDLHGATMIPGLIDTHVHLVRTGLSMIGPVLPSARTVDELLANVRKAISDFPGTDPLMCHGGGVRWLDREPTRWDLDAITGDRPVLVSDPSAHVSLVNSAALAQIDLTGQRGVELTSDGQPSGVLITWANKAVRRWFHSRVPEDQIRQGLLLATKAASRRGVTTIHAMDGGDYLGDADVPTLLASADDLPVDLVVYPQILDVEQVEAWGLPRVGGCILIDGAYGEHTAALRDPYTDVPSTSGVLFHSGADVDAFVLDAHRRGLQITVHAQGDAAIEQILSAYERALAAHPRADHRHRIEHCGLPTRDQLQRIAALQIGLGMQPVFAPPHPSLPAMFGDERVTRRHQYRAIRALGIVIGGGSDADSSPIDPFIGLHAMSTLDDERRLSPYEALELFTTNAAYLAFQEGERGALKVGSRADLAILDGDPLSVTGESLKTLAVRETWLGGQAVYREESGREVPGEERGAKPM